MGLRSGIYGMAVLALCLSGIGSGTQGRAATGVGAERGLTAFRSDAELRKFLLRLRKPAAAVPESGEIVVTGSRVATPSITNTQEADVDEGGIVKVRGDTLVILRRGRLFTVSLAGGGMRAVDSIDASPPGVSGRNDWYDEMLLSGDRVIVIGYSYGRGGTEINRFRLDSAGRLSFEDAYHMRSNDYYSSRNYASRLIGTRLITYTPLDLRRAGDPFDALPGLRRWRGDDKKAFRRIASARRVFVPPAFRDGRDTEITALHTVTTCDLAAVVLDCSATGVLGPYSRNFYVSGRAVYLWVSDAGSRDSRRRGGPSAAIYRLPLDGGRPSAIGARGAPVDQFSFRENVRDATLDVLVRAEGGGDGMWRPEVSEGTPALLRVPLGAFGDGTREAALRRYRPLPGGGGYEFHNRFVGDHLLYGSGGGYRGTSANDRTTVYAVPVRGGPVAAIPLFHGIDRIEALGSDALVVGGGEEGRNGEGALGFSAIELTRGAARLGDRYTLPAASEGESRSHAFFYSPDVASPDGVSGVLGLPIARATEPSYQRFFGSAASMLFLRRDDRRFGPAGELAAEYRGVVDDGCRASCVDWYGNARPIFLGPRTFALLGYELVEGRIARGKGRDSQDGRGRVTEVGRVDFAPRPGRVRR